MEKDFQLGPEAKAVMKLEGGKIVLGVQYDGKQASALAQVSMDIEQYAILLKEAIKGPVDDVIIDALINMMKAV